jgi:hypothetical protein
MAPGLVGQAVERARDMQRMQPPQPPPAKPFLAACGYPAMTRAEMRASLDLLST